MHIQEALGEVASWLHAIFCEPALQLGTASALLSAAGPDPAVGDSYNSTAPQLLPFSSVTVRLEWTSAGAVSPLKYEPTGRIILQVRAGCCLSFKGDGSAVNRGAYQERSLYRQRHEGQQGRGGP